MLGSVGYSVGGETYSALLVNGSMIVSLHGYRIATIVKHDRQWSVSGIDDGAPQTRHRSLADAMTAAASRY